MSRQILPVALFLFISASFSAMALGTAQLDPALCSKVDQQLLHFSQKLMGQDSITDKEYLMMEENFVLLTEPSLFIKNEGSVKQLAEAMFETFKNDRLSIKTQVQEKNFRRAWRSTYALLREARRTLDSQQMATLNKSEKNEELLFVNNFCGDLDSLRAMHKLFFDAHVRQQKVNFPAYITDTMKQLASNLLKSKKGSGWQIIGWRENDTSVFLEIASPTLLEIGEISLEKAPFPLLKKEIGGEIAKGKSQPVQNSEKLALGQSGMSIDQPTNLEGRCVAKQQELYGDIYLYASNVGILELINRSAIKQNYSISSYRVFMCQDENRRKFQNAEIKGIFQIQDSATCNSANRKDNNLYTYATSARNTEPLAIFDIGATGTLTCVDGEG